MRRGVRVVLDTNIIISALLFGGDPERIFLAGLRGEIQLITSRALLRELETVLKEKFKLGMRLVKDVLDLIQTLTEIVEVTSRLTVIAHPDDDNRVLECAVDGNAECIVTGDTKHILPLKEYKGIKIFRPSEFVRFLPPSIP
jgi:putative PIN family toxin of toxin-antitoxin system